MGLTRLVRLPGDTLVAGNNLKVATFSPNGGLVREQIMDWSGAASLPMFVESQYPLHTGDFVLYALTSSSGQRVDGELSRRPWHTARRRGSRGGSDTLGSFLGLEQMTYRDVDGRHTAIPLFPAATMMMIGASHVVIGDQVTVRAAVRSADPFSSPALLRPQRPQRLNPFPAAD